MVLQFKGPQFHYLLLTDTDREPEVTIHRHSEESYFVFCVRGSLRELRAIALDTDKGTYSLNVASVLNVEWDVAEIPPEPSAIFFRKSALTAIRKLMTFWKIPKRYRILIEIILFS